MNAVFGHLECFFHKLAHPKDGNEFCDRDYCETTHTNVGKRM